MQKYDGFVHELYDQYNKFRKDVPSLLRGQKFTEDIINVLFPFKADKRCTLPQIELNLAQLQIDFRTILNPLEESLKYPISKITKDFFNKIPSLYKSLMDDANHFLDFDPAAHSVESVILYYPGFYAISVYRLSNVLYNLDIPFLPRIMSEYAHSKTGIDIHPGADIGKNFLIDHGTGIVIGETTHIGNNVKIYQGVTLGAICVEKEMRGKKRHPTIEDNVIIYSGSTILGGKTVVGEGTVVGGNVWLTKSVAPNSIVYHESKTVVRDSKKTKPEPINFVI